MKWRKGPGVWVLYGAFILLLTVAAYLFYTYRISQQREHLMATAESQFQLITSLLRSELQHGHGQKIQPILSELGAANSAITALTLKTPNGTLLGRYQRDQPAKETHPLKAAIRYSGEGLATMTYVLGLDGLEQDRKSLLLQLVATLALIIIGCWHLARLSLIRTLQAEKLERITHTLNKRNRRLRRGKQKYRRLVENLQAHMLFSMTPKGYLYYISPSVLTILGYSPGEVIGHIRQYITDSPLNRHLPQLAKLANISPQHPFEAEVYHKNGSRVILEVILGAIRKGRQLISIDGIAHDVTEQKKIRDELNLAASVFAESSEGICIIDAQGIILRCNQALSRQTGFATEELVGRSIASLNSGAQDPVFYQEIGEALGNEKRWQGEVLNRRKNGETFPAWLTLTSISNINKNGSRHIVCICSDISEIKKAQQKIHHLAYHDSLTDLPNRTLLYDRLHQLLHRAKRHHRISAALFIDLDNFKDINDEFGHPIGDLLLKATANRLIRHIRREDTVARLGGDEFIILLSELGADRERVKTDVIHLAEKIRQAVEAPHTIDGHNIISTVSIGVTLLPEENDTPTRVCKRADIAMYKAKTSGRDRVSFYAEDQD